MVNDAGDVWLATVPAEGESELSHDELELFGKKLAGGLSDAKKRPEVEDEVGVDDLGIVQFEASYWGIKANGL